jgi:hypothetical protein
MKLIYKKILTLLASGIFFSALPAWAVDDIPCALGSEIVYDEDESGCSGEESESSGEESGEEVSIEAEESGDDPDDGSGGAGALLAELGQSCVALELPDLNACDQDLLESLNNYMVLQNELTQRLRNLHQMLHSGSVDMDPLEEAVHQFFNTALQLSNWITGLEDNDIQLRPLQLRLSLAVLVVFRDLRGYILEPCIHQAILAGIGNTQKGNFAESLGGDTTMSEETDTLLSLLEGRIDALSQGLFEDLWTVLRFISVGSSLSHSDAIQHGHALFFMICLGVAKDVLLEIAGEVRAQAERLINGYQPLKASAFAARLVCLIFHEFFGKSGNYHLMYGQIQAFFDNPFSIFIQNELGPIALGPALDGLSPIDQSFAALDAVILLFQMDSNQQHFADDSEDDQEPPHKKQKRGE